MPPRTQAVHLLPWSGGLNTSLDESMIASNQLTVADNILIGSRPVKKKREGINHDFDDQTAGTDLMIGLHDFWYGASSKTQKYVGINSARAKYTWNVGTGARTTITDAGTAWAGTLTTCSMVTFNNLCIIAVDGAANVVKKWDGTNDIADLDGTPPVASILRTHIGRLITNDKANVDRLHYSPAFDHTKWNGTGDSGAFDIGTGDGDPDGITAIFPTFKGDLFVAKRTKLYRLVGQSPEEIQIIKVSDSIGCISHNSVVQVGQDDIMWVSEKGVHSLQAVAAYGDFTSVDVSVDIQKTFNDDFTRSRLKYSWGAYLPQINSVAWAFTESSGLNRTLTTSSVNNAVYLFNVTAKAWYRWPDIPCTSLIVANDSGEKRFWFGTHTNRISKSFSGDAFDKVGNSGTQTAITMRVASGQMFMPGAAPTDLVAYKEFILHYRPSSQASVNVSVKIDKQSIPAENRLVYQESTGGTPLGTGFVLGSTPLGTTAVMSGYARSITGQGHTAKVTIEESSLTGEVEIQGIGLRFEPLTYVSEVAS